MAGSFTGTRSYIQGMFLPDASSMAQDLVKPADTGQSLHSVGARGSMAADGAFLDPASDFGSSSDAFFDAR